MMIVSPIRSMVLAVLCGLSGWFATRELRSLSTEAPRVMQVSQSLATEAAPEEFPIVEWGDGVFDELLRRPLFNATRRPIPPSVPAVSEAPPLGPPPALKPPPALMQLIVVGVAIDPARRIVLVRSPATGPVLMLQEGQALEGWRLERIEAAAALFRNGNAEMQVRFARAEQKKQQTGPASRPGAGR